MYQQYSDIYHPAVGTVLATWPKCGVCNTAMKCEQDVSLGCNWFSTTTRQVDLYSCLYSKEKWHQQAKELWELLDKCKSPSLSQLYWEDLQEVLKQHQCTISKYE